MACAALEEERARQEGSWTRQEGALLRETHLEAYWVPLHRYRRERRCLAVRVPAPQLLLKRVILRLGISHGKAPLAEDGLNLEFRKLGCLPTRALRLELELLKILFFLGLLVTELFEWQ